MTFIGKIGSESCESSDSLDNSAFDGKFKLAEGCAGALLSVVDVSCWSDLVNDSIVVAVVDVFASEDWESVLASF